MLAVLKSYGWEVLGIEATRLIVNKSRHNILGVPQFSAQQSLTCKLLTPAALKFSLQVRPSNWSHGARKGFAYFPLLLFTGVAFCSVASNGFALSGTGIAFLSTMSEALTSLP